MPEPRRTFGPVVLLGLAAGALSAVAGNKVWAEVADGADSGTTGAAAATGLSFTDTGQMPLSAALSLVVLAAWGVLLVTRGVVRTGVAWLGLLASLGVLATVVVGYSSTQDDVADALRKVGLTSVDTAVTGWFWAAAVGAVLSVVATALAVRYVRHWPAMGSRYDAPGSAPARSVEPGEAADGELWRAIDEGHDPTA